MFETELARTTRNLRASPHGFQNLRRGIHVDAATWASNFAEGRHYLRAQAVTLAAESAPVFSHTTAAGAGWELPLYRVSDRTIHVIDPDEHPAKSRGDVVRHALPLSPDDIVSKHGLQVTSLERTVYDVIRMPGLETALACYDAALRLVAWNDDSRTLDESAAAIFNAGIDGRIRSHTGARGIRQARLVAEMADGRAQLPGESVSRLRMWELRLPAPELQYRVRTSEGTAYLDFAWPGLHLFGECDGAVKLVDPRFTRGRTPAEVLADAEHRQRLVEEATGWEGIRWGANAYEAAASFATTVGKLAPRLFSSPRR